MIKNIKKNNDRIKCCIIPEDCREEGYLSVNLKSQEIENCELPEGYEWCTNHISHARRELLKMVKRDNIPNDKLIMWY